MKVIKAETPLAIFLRVFLSITDLLVENNLKCLPLLITQQANAALLTGSQTSLVLVNLTIKPQSVLSCSYLRSPATYVHIYLCYTTTIVYHAYQRGQT